MQREIDVADLEQRFPAVLDDVAQQRVSYVLTRANLPEAVLIPYEEFSRFQQLDEAEVFAQLERLLTRMAHVNAAYSDEEVAADIAAAQEAP